MTKWFWRQFVWPNLLRPYLLRRALVIPYAKRVELARAIEDARMGGPVTADTVGLLSGTISTAVAAALEEWNP